MLPWSGDIAAEDSGLADAAAACGGESFTAGAKVLLANRIGVPIAGLKPGDKVLATSTRTGKTRAEPVTAVLVHHDTNRYDLTIKTAHGTGVIDTTSTHLFWDPATRQWAKAATLGHGTRLRTPSGATAMVVGGHAPRNRDGRMWDLTVTNDHDFYIQVASSAVLVHNCPVFAGRDPAFERILRTRSGHRLTASMMLITSSRSSSVEISHKPVLMSTIQGTGRGSPAHCIRECRASTPMIGPPSCKEAPPARRCSTSDGCSLRNTGSMSTSEELDVTRVRSIQVRGHRGLRVDLRTNHPPRKLVRGMVPESEFFGVVREKGELADLVSTFWAAVFLLSDRFRDALEQHQLSGWGTVPVSITGLASVKTLWLLTVSGTCGRLYGVDGDPVPGVRVGNFLDPAQWDGSDLFVAENHNAIFVTPRCADILQAIGLANLELRQEGLEPLIRR